MRFEALEPVRFAVSLHEQESEAGAVVLLFPGRLQLPVTLRVDVASCQGKAPSDREAECPRLVALRRRG